MSLAALLEADLPAYVGIAKRMPDVLPSIPAVLLANLLAAIALSVLPALDVLALLYTEYRARPN